MNTTKTLQKAEIILPSMDIGLLRKMAEKFGCTIKLEKPVNKIDKSLEDAAAGRTFTAQNIDDLMDHLLKE